MPERAYHCLTSFQAGRSFHRHWPPHEPRRLLRCPFLLYLLRYACGLGMVIRDLAGRCWTNWSNHAWWVYRMHIILACNAPAALLGETPFEVLRAEGRSDGSLLSCSRTPKSAAVSLWARLLRFQSAFIVAGTASIRASIEIALPAACQWDLHPEASFRRQLVADRFFCQQCAHAPVPAPGVRRIFSCCMGSNPRAYNLRVLFGSLLQRL